MKIRQKRKLDKIRINQSNSDKKNDKISQSKEIRNNHLMLQINLKSFHLRPPSLPASLSKLPENISDWYQAFLPHSSRRINPYHSGPTIAPFTERRCRRRRCLFPPKSQHTTKVHPTDPLENGRFRRLLCAAAQHTAKKGSSNVVEGGQVLGAINVPPFMTGISLILRALPAPHTSAST